jgi:hypothetical protein
MTPEATQQSTVPSPIKEGSTGSNESIVIGPGGMVVTLEAPLLISACAARGWSLAELGRRAGLSRPTLIQALRGEAVRPKTAWKIRRALAQAETLEGG